MKINPGSHYKLLRSLQLADPNRSENGASLIFEKFFEMLSGQVVHFNEWKFLSKLFLIFEIGL